MSNKTSKQIEMVEAYIEAYNSFDVAAMIKDFSPEIHFQNSSEGQINLSLLGIGAFREQALQATALLSERVQTITAISERESVVEVEIDYTGVLKMDLPNGLQAGESITLKGRSVFEFADDKIVSLKDIS